jgi:hypothetical protein
MGLNLNFQRLEARGHRDRDFFKLWLTYPVAESG